MNIHEAQIYALRSQLRTAQSMLSAKDRKLRAVETALGCKDVEIAQKQSAIDGLVGQIERITKENAKLKATPKRKKFTRRTPAVYTGYRQLDVEGHAHFVINGTAIFKRLGVMPRKGFARLRDEGHLDKNNYPSEYMRDQELVVMKSKQPYFPKGGEKFISDLKDDGIFDDCLVKKGTK